jgi:hypothetical protein
VSKLCIKATGCRNAIILCFSVLHAALLISLVIVTGVCCKRRQLYIISFRRNMCRACSSITAAELPKRNRALLRNSLRNYITENRGEYRPVCAAVTIRKKKEDARIVCRTWGTYRWNNSYLLLLWICSYLLGLGLFLKFVILFTVGRTPWTGISPSQGRSPHTGKHKHILHASSGIRTHDPSMYAGKGNSCYRPRGHCYRQKWQMRT